MDYSMERLVPRRPLYQTAASPGMDSHITKNHLEINRVFEKKFHYQKGRDENSWTLPPPRELLGEFYQFESLQELKIKLNDVKCKLNDYALEEWSQHTRRQDPTNEIPWRLKKETKAEFVTVAWCKFFECLHAFPLVKGPKLNSLHLCELPGAFIAALNHYLYSTYKREEVQWRWLSTTLNPYYEGNPTGGMITDDRFMFHTFDNWLMHDDFTGNIIDRAHIEQMQAKCKERLGSDVNLITADGSIDCADTPDCQEEVVATLHFAEITAALTILAEGGCFVVKMFTLFESTNVCKLFLLNCAFDAVHVYKPATSKRGNSEVYVICIGYRKQTPHLSETLQLMLKNVECANILPLFPKSSLPKDFLLQHEICARLFMNLQIQSIESNIQAYEIKPTRRQITYKQQLRTAIANEFYRRYKVYNIPEKDKILYGYPKTDEIYQSAPFCRGSYSEREMAKITSLEQRIFEIHCALNFLEKSLDNTHDFVYEEVSAKTATDSLDVLRIYRGAPFAELHSSMFAHPYIMQMHQKMKDIFGSDPISIIKYICVVDGKEIPLSDNHVQSSSRHQQELFLKLFDAICEKPPSQLVFTNNAFLTHLSVSILLYLSTYIFERLTLCGEPHFQIKLHTKSSKYTPEQMDTLKRLQTLLADDPNVLCVMPIKNLHRNEFAKALHSYNNQLLMKNFKLFVKN
ncbi:cap-specific mRNA (nucleoside-2'-O-)-methyltransferase 2 [Eurosta solidaginis]|uniref:cap-specific mRNA (nucleoside-2'-O-)-methyltransferase 2 n=1 Tax=Eurosta solidaginis TaxID=178769 RepID=UPI003530ADE9